MPAFHDLHHTALHQVGGRQIFNTLAAQLNGALGDRAALTLQQIGNGAQCGGLARTVAAEYGDDFALRHLQRDALEHEDHVVVDHLDAVDV